MNGYNHRLLGASDASLAAHVGSHGPLPRVASVEQLASASEAAQLRGRGGAGFPMASKLRSLAGSGALLIANGAEGEPLSSKDRTLLHRAPHLVLDGLAAIAAVTRPSRVVVLARPGDLYSVLGAAQERDDLNGLEVVEASGAFVEGEASAALQAVRGKLGLPVHHAHRLSSGDGKRGTAALVQNVESLATLALALRAFAGQGRVPSTRLYTVSGDVASPGVIEAAVGTSAEALSLAAGGSTAGGFALVGGYHGRWVSGLDAALPGSAEAGAGIVHVVSAGWCPLDVVAAAMRTLAEASAGQCGPCRFGLPRIAGVVDQLAGFGAGQSVLREAESLMRQVDGRGACAHPDGAVGFLRSSLEVLWDEFVHHSKGQCCCASLVTSGGVA